VALALYRKYRPRTFAEVIGQEHVTEPLMQALRTGRLNHAYLFSGPRGCGKTSSARILARSLNCEKGPTPEPCGQCDSCVALAPDGAGSIDVIEIDAASHGGVDDARDLRERAFFAPVASRFKVYVIDEAHMVSSAGFNALLKLVEEPPDYVKFVFATTEPEKVLGTIKSRTHHYPFRLIPPGVLRPYLESLCASEGVEVEPAVFPLVVRAGAGSVRDSLSVLDQLIAGAGAEGVTYARAVALLGVTDVALIDEMCDALAAGDGASAYATIDRVVEAGHDPRRFASDLLERLRNLIILQQVPDAVTKGLLDGADDELSRMSAQAQRFGAATLSRMADIVHNGLTEMRGTTAPRLLLELVCARMLLPGADDSTGALLQRLERLERRYPVTGDTPPAPVAPGPSTAPASPAVPAPPAASAPPAAPPQSAPRQPAPPAAPPQSTPRQPAPSAEATAAPGVVDVATVRRYWDEILANVRRRKQSAAALLREATVREVDGDTLVLLFKHGFHANSVAGDPQYLQDAVHEVLDGTWQVRCEFGGQVVGPAPAPGSSAPAASATRSGEAPPRQAATGDAAPRQAATGDAPPRQAATGDAPRDEADWPAPARPGGGTPADPATGSPSAPGGRGPARASRPGRAASNTPVPRSQARNGEGGARAAARAAATGGRSGRGQGGRPATPRPGAATGTRSEAPPPDEPPYDPDYDPPVRDPRGYEGFDPGDEPLEDVDEQATRQTSEQQALRLLQQALGAEKIGEVDSGRQP
jgi:DNA polymerase III subunit gamma/tau